LSREQRRETAQWHRKRRRTILERICSNPTYTATASKLAVVMLAHSDDFAKGVYPSQKQLAEELDVHPSTVQRAVAELEAGGDLFVRRFEPVRSGETGRWRRRLCNFYTFRIAKGPGQGRRVKRRPSSDLNSTGATWNLIDTRNHRPSGRGGGSVGSVDRSLRPISSPSAPTHRRVVVLDEGFDAADFVSDDAWAAPIPAQQTPEAYSPVEPWSFSRQRFSEARNRLLRD
jgi:hypothetical protein